MVKEFWSELLTKESWNKLTELAGKYDFILIGGWAGYLWTKAHKSKTIDIIVDYDVLKQLGSDFELSKNQRMRKYEIKLDKFDIDIYVPFFSKLAIPTEDIRNYVAKIEGITTVKPEALLVLKQAAEIERRGSVKGKKDAVDILTILIRAPVDLETYKRILKKYGLEAYSGELRHVVSTFSDKDIDYLGLGFTEFKKWKKGFLEKLAKL